MSIWKIQSSMKTCETFKLVLTQLREQNELELDLALHLQFLLTLASWKLTQILHSDKRAHVPVLSFVAGGIISDQRCPEADCVGLYSLGPAVLDPPLLKQWRCDHNQHNHRAREQTYGVDQDLRCSEQFLRARYCCSRAIDVCFGSSFGGGTVGGDQCAQ